MGRPNEVRLGIYCTQILTSEDDIVAIPGQQLDVAGYMNQDSRHGFLLANRKFGLMVNVTMMSLSCCFEAVPFKTFFCWR